MNKHTGLNSPLEYKRTVHGYETKLHDLNKMKEKCVCSGATYTFSHLALSKRDKEDQALCSVSLTVITNL